jgi:hypothetical protein
MPTFVCTEPHEIAFQNEFGERDTRFFKRGAEVEADALPGKYWMEGKRADLPYDPRFDGMPPPTARIFPGLLRPKEPDFLKAMRSSDLGKRGDI